MGTLIQIIAIGIRVASIFVFLSGVATLFSTSYMLRNVGDPLMYLWWLVIIIPVVAAVVMWKYPLPIARGIVPEVENEGSIKNLSKNQLMVAVLTIVGIGILAVTIPDLFYWVSHLISAHYFSDTPFKGLFPGFSFEGLFSTVIKIVLGIWLMLGGEGILNAVNRMRFAKPPS